jgi:ATP phosphoribosyltransferase
VELNRQILDLAIIGEDWVREESVNLNEELIQKVGDLDYGQTRLIVAVPNDDPYESLTEFFRANKDRKHPILCFTDIQT